MGVLREGSEKVRVRTTLIYTRMIKGCAAHPCSLAMLVRERASLSQEPTNGKPSTPFLSSPEKKKEKKSNSIKNAHTIKISWRTPCPRHTRRWYIQTRVFVGVLSAMIKVACNQYTKTRGGKM